MPSFPTTGSDWISRIDAVEDATVVTAYNSHRRQKAGVLDAQGDYVDHGIVWRFDKRMTLAPDMPERVKGHLEGRWIWGGILFDHFGHFLVESLSRLWAAHAGERFDGICFIPKRRGRSGGLKPYQENVLQAFGITAPVRLLNRPARVDTLLVPGQAFGLGALAQGAPVMHDAVHAHFGTDIAPDGPERLYVSRTGLGMEAGAIVGEADIEAHLAAEGYEIFHPQDHDLATQIARYKAARKLVFADGSAGHLYAYVGRADQDVAYILRRSFWTEGPIDHITGFTGKAPLVVDTVAREWVPAFRNKAYRGMAYAEHDMPALQARLIEGGFIAPGPVWPNAESDRGLAYLQERRIAGDFKLVETA